MTTYIFFKKELRESLRTSKLLMIWVIFIIFGMMSPVLAKYTNEIIKNYGGLGNVQGLEEPTYVHSFAQLFKNNGMIGMFVLIFSYMGTMSREKDKKTVYLMLTKGLSRKGMIMAKYFSSLLVYSGAYLVSSLLFCYYTFTLFGDFPREGVPEAFALFWMFGAFILAITLFFSNITNNISASAVLSIGCYFLMSALTALKPIKQFIPNRLVSLPLELVGGSIKIGECMPTVVTTLGIILLLLVGSVMIFKEQEL